MLFYLIFIQCFLSGTLQLCWCVCFSWASDWLFVRVENDHLTLLKSKFDQLFFFQVASHSGGTHKIVDRNSLSIIPDMIIFYGVR